MFDALWYSTRLGQYAYWAGDAVWQADAIDGGTEIYRVKVTRAAPSLGGVFADAGGKQVLVNCAKEPLPAVGEVVNVYLVEAARGTKCAVCRLHPAIAGDYVVYYPDGDELRFARTLSTAVKEACMARFPRGVGCMVRTKVDESVIDGALAELGDLQALWRQRAADVGVGLVYKTPVDVERYARRATDVLCDDEALCLQYGWHYAPDLAERWQRTVAPATADLDTRCRTADGVELVIERTEACTVVDVNSRGVMPDMPADNAALYVNRLAAREVLRQMCLRDITGVILVDFVSMHAKYRRIFWEELSTLVGIDERVRLVDMTQLGFVELTRSASEVQYGK
jgi:ribonuclease G